MNKEKNDPYNPFALLVGATFFITLGYVANLPETQIYTKQREIEGNQDKINRAEQEIRRSLNKNKGLQLEIIQIRSNLRKK